MPKPNTIPLEEVRRLSEEAMNSTIQVLQALAESDRKVSRSGKGR
jgi:hypothetical protein